MPLSVSERLILGELTPTGMTLQMVDRTLAHPEGILEDVLIKVGKFVFPMDFVVINIEGRQTGPIAVRKTILSNRSIID